MCHMLVIHCSVHICRKTFRPAYGKLDILGSIFANVPFLALTATANSETKSMIIESLQLTDVELIEVNPDRENIFYDVKNRPSHGDDKLDPILKPVANMLKELKLQMELTIIYGTLQTCADCFLYFSKALKKHQYFPEGSEPISKNRLFAQYHAECPDHEKDRIIEELIQGVCTARVLFVTIAFGMGIDIHDIRHVIHIGVPKTIEEYFQETGRAGRDGCPSVATMYYNNFDIRSGKHQVDEVMREFVTSNSCKRSIILNYFGHSLKRESDFHNCCSYHRSVCKCPTCLVVTSNSAEDQTTPTPATEHVSYSCYQKTYIKNDLEAYRASLCCGNSFAGNITLSTGFSIELIDLAVECCSEVKSADDVYKILPVFSREHAHAIFEIISRHST